MIVVALDGFVCAFAIAVINKHAMCYAENAVDQEGLIAVERVREPGIDYGLDARLNVYAQMLYRGEAP